ARIPAVFSNTRTSMTACRNVRRKLAIRDVAKSTSPSRRKVTTRMRGRGGRSSGFIDLTRYPEHVPLLLNHLPKVMAGLAATHVVRAEGRQDVDAREDGVPAACRGGVSLRAECRGKLIGSHRRAPTESLGGTHNSPAAEPTHAQVGRRSLSLARSSPKWRAS